MLKTFKKGGIHVPDNKFTKNISTVIYSLPETVYIPLLQHIGTPALPIVKSGDKVKTGQLIAKPDGIISSNIHSSVTGTVIKIDEVHDISGNIVKAIIINSEPDEWLETIDTTDKLIDNISLNSNEILKKIFDAGIVGLGGATFPSHFKLTVPKDKKVDTLVINGSECEPYISSDYRLMLEKTEEIIVGINIILKVLNISNALIGIENNKKEAVEKFQALLKDNENIKVFALQTKYPQGSEKHLIKTLTQREVPSGKIPVDVGIVVHNIATIFSIYEAVQKNKPLIERTITFTGKSFFKPINYKVRVGTPIFEIIENSGGIPSDTGKIIVGGPMMGKAIISRDTPVTKGTTGIVLLTTKEAERTKPYNCIRCGSCVKACPMGLSPYLISKLAENNNYEQCEKESIIDCIECGSCMYICPSNILLLDSIRKGKNRVNKIKSKRQKLINDN